jgi:hypothetical protein
VLAGITALSVLRADAINLSPGEREHIGKRIWQNECGGTVAGLTSWNVGENFASLGIGHFIWYPAGARGPFDESFPKLIAFLDARGAKLPQFLRGDLAPCPWKTRAEFTAAQQTPQMKELRAFLASSVDLQAEFLVQRLQKSLPKMTAEAGSADAAKVRRQFERVASTGQGCYALIDYVNFKGEGVLATERYNGRGWGLLQVLEGMSGDASGPAAMKEFAASARAVLQERVRNSPPERHEARWLPGWLTRVAGYAHT